MVVLSLDILQLEEMLEEVTPEQYAELHRHVFERQEASRSSAGL